MPCCCVFLRDCACVQTVLWLSGVTCMACLLQFLVYIQEPEEEGLYNLFFHNCLSYSKDAAALIGLTVSVGSLLPSALEHVEFY